MNNVKMVKLGDVAEINPRCRPKASDKTSVSFVPMAGVSEGGYLAFEEAKTFGEVKKGYTAFQRGDVLFAKITPCMENGKACLTDTIKYEAGFGSTEFHVLRATKEIDSKYLFYLVWNEPFRSLARKNMKGAAGQKRVSTEFMASLKIPLPPLPEQKRIAEILDLADEARRKRRENLSLFDDLIRSLFLQTFGDITSDREQTTVAELARQKRGAIRTGPFGSQLLHSEFVDEGIAILGIDNAVNNRFEWGAKRYITPYKYEQLKRYTVNPGDVLVTIMGTCGRCAVVPENIPLAINTKHLCCITVDRDKCLPEFLQACFLYHPGSQAHLSSRAKGAIMNGLNIGIIKDMPLPSVPISQQAIFVERVQAINAQKICEQALADQHDDLFNSLLQRAFKGELGNVE
jgi:type I restriction enzyme S subunit